MALVCPLLTTPSPEGSCVGHFISADQLHLVSPDGHGLQFEQLLPEADVRPARVHLAMDGRIEGLHRIPLPDASQDSGANSAPDILLIHTQTTTEASLKDHLHFKRYNPVLQELETMSSLTCDAGPLKPRHAPYAFAVREESGPMSGTVAFATTALHSVCFVDPCDPKRASFYDFRADNEGLRQATLLCWISDNLVIASEKSIGGYEALEFLKIERQHRAVESSFVITNIGRISLSGVAYIEGLGPLRDYSGNTQVAVVLSDGSVKIYAWTENRVRLVGEQRHELCEKREEVEQNYTNWTRIYHLRWALMWPASGTECFFLADDGLVLRVVRAMNVSTFKIKGLPRNAALGALSLDIYKVFTGFEHEVQLARISTDGTCKLLKPLSYDFEMPYQFDYLRLVKHERHRYLGSRFWFLFYRECVNEYVRTHLCRIERSLGARVLPIQHYPFSAPITGMWWVGGRLIVSTRMQTAAFEICGPRLKSVASEFDGGPTIAAAQGIQVTPDAISFNKGRRRRVLEFRGIVSAAIYGQQAVAASVDIVLMVVNGRAIRRTAFDEPIVGVSVWKSTLAVCTVQTLHIFLGGHKSLMYPLRNVATCVACGPNGRRVYVGDTMGDIFIWPEQDYVNIGRTPIKAMRTQTRTVTVLAGSEGSICIDGHGKFVRLRVGDADDLHLRSSSTRFGAILFKGVISLLELDSTPTAARHVVKAPESILSHRKGAKFYGQFIYSLWDSRGTWDLRRAARRQLQRAPLHDLGAIETFELPSFKRSRLTDFQGFMLNETRLLEVAKEYRWLEPLNAENEFDVADAFDGRAHVFMRLYELGPKLGQVTILDEKAFSTPEIWCVDVVVKLYSPAEFIIFTCNQADSVTSTVACGAEPAHDPRILRIGKVTSHCGLICDDHLMSSGKDGGGVMKVSRSGEVSCVSTQTLRDFGSRRKSVWNKATQLGNVSSGGRISSALVLRSSEPGNAYLMTAAKTQGWPINKVSVAEVGQTRLVDVVSMQIDDPHVDFLALASHGRDGASCVVTRGRNTSNYAKALLPSVAIGTGRGGLYVWSRIRDPNLARALLNVQGVLRQSIEVISADVAEDRDCVDGALLLTALRNPDAEPVFANAGLYAAALKRALEGMSCLNSCMW